MQSFSINRGSGQGWSSVGPQKCRLYWCKQEHNLSNNLQNDYGNRLWRSKTHHHGTWVQSNSYHLKKSVPKVSVCDQKRRFTKPFLLFCEGRWRNLNCDKYHLILSRLRMLSTERRASTSSRDSNPAARPSGDSFPTDECTFRDASWRAGIKVICGKKFSRKHVLPVQKLSHTSRLSIWAEIKRVTLLLDPDRNCDEWREIPNCDGKNVPEFSNRMCSGKVIFLRYNAPCHISREVSKYIDSRVLDSVLLPLRLVKDHKTLRSNLLSRP